ncbi:hypothetical protein [Legionella tunisiensis]|uniref:hypothetical protein n=1 Tax=Legionella tunisiensis TaxID=1034944 RepID=UPI0002EBD7F2|nr:hypothetical protein [Legionella tunisiensis]
MYKPDKVDMIQNIDIVAAAPLIRELSNRVFNDEDYMYLNFYNHLPSILNSTLIRSRSLDPRAIGLACKALSNAPVADEMLVVFLISRTSKPTFLIKDTVEELNKIIKQLPENQQAMIQPYIDEYTAYDEFYKNHKDRNNQSFQNFFQQIDTMHMSESEAFDKKDLTYCGSFKI